MKRRSLGMLLGLLFSMPVLASETPPPPNQVGQWIWSARDVGVYNKEKQSLPNLVPSPWVATAFFSEEKISIQKALSPMTVADAPIAAVLRIDDSFHGAWSSAKFPKLANELNDQIAELLHQIEATGAQVTEIQIDYDCPVIRLPQWATLLATLSHSSLRGKNLWITSLLAHLKDPNFGRRLQGIVAGHILQVFDTGEDIHSSPPEWVSRQLEAQGLPFRMGIGAFERNGPLGPATEHRAWFAALPEFSKNPWYRGVWVFPGSRRWASLLPSLERSP